MINSFQISRYFPGILREEKKGFPGNSRYKKKVPGISGISGISRISRHDGNQEIPKTRNDCIIPETLSIVNTKQKKME